MYLMKLLGFILLALTLVSGFVLQIENNNDLSDIPWPYVNCGDGNEGWTVESLTLNSVPKKNTTNDIDVVNY